MQGLDGKVMPVTGAEFDYMQRRPVRARLNRAGTASLIRQGRRDLRNH